MANIALQARLCYNQSINIVVAQQVLTHLLSRFTIRRVGSYRMDILRPNAPDSNPEKKCTGPCGRTLPATAQFFHAAEKGKYGLTAKCKDCRLAYQHRPEILAHKQVYDKVYRSLPEFQERNSTYQKAYRANTEKGKNAYRFGSRNIKNGQGYVNRHALRFVTAVLAREPL